MSSSDERSPKRQRRSYSPASPALGTTKAFVQPPQTPPPSVHMSPSWQSSQIPGLGQHGADPVTNSQTFPTPPSTSGMQSQAMARGASSEGMVAGTRQTTPIVEGETEPARATVAEAPTVDSQSVQIDGRGDVSMADSTEHRRTDHERQELDDTVPPLPSAKVLYKLSAEPIASARPLFSQNVIELYGMEHVQASVQRKDPMTGAKINKLRKSYDGKVKDLGLEGRNKASKQEGWFTGFLHPGWDMVVEDGRSLWDVDKAEFNPGSSSDDRLFDLLDKALDMRPGRLPKHEYNEWKNLLGLEEMSIPTKPAQLPNSAGPSRTATSSFLAKTAPGTAMHHSAPVSPRAVHGRPDRQGKKRRYDERSYEGYTEAYEDDGYDTAGMDESSRRDSASKRQKRKDFTPSNSPPFANNLANRNGSMLGIKSS